MFRNMFQNEKSKNIMLAVLVICLISLTVVYATLSQDLNIKGVATVKQANWDIHFTKLLSPKAEGDATAGKAVLNGNSTIITISDGVFSAPGDKITYEFNVINDGDIDAEVELTTTQMENCKAENGTDVTNFCNKIEFELFYKDTKAPVAKGDKLLGKEEKTLNLVITYDKNRALTSLPTSPITLSNITSIINYRMIEPQKTTPSTPTEDQNKELTTFSTDSWSTIVANVQSGKKYKIGDTKEVDMGSFGKHTVRVANNTSGTTVAKSSKKSKIASKVAADVNSSNTESNGCGTPGFSETACGFVVEFADIITEYQMNSTYTNKGGWPATEMRQYLNNDIYNALPKELRNAIIDTYVVSGHGKSYYNCTGSSGESTSETTSEYPSESTSETTSESGGQNCEYIKQDSNFTSTDKLYLLSTKEVYGEADYFDTVDSETRQLDYYKETSSNNSGAIKEYNKSSYDWGLRSPKSQDINHFATVGNSGYLWWNGGDYWSIDIYGVSPAFRLR